MLIINRTIIYTGRRARDVLIAGILRVRRHLREVWVRSTSAPSSFPPNGGTWDPDSPAFLDYLHASASGLLHCPLTRRSVDELERILLGLISLDPERPNPPEIWSGGDNAAKTNP
jgi:hypothetical protein